MRSPTGEEPPWREGSDGRRRRICREGAAAAPPRNKQARAKGASGLTGPEPKGVRLLADLESERDCADAAVVFGIAWLRTVNLDDGEVCPPPQIQLVSGFHSGAA